MGKKKDAAFKKALATVQEYVSDNNSEDSSQGGTNVGLALLLAGMSNQSSSASSQLADSYRNSLNRTDEDVNATEAIKAMAPAWPINMKNVVSAEYAKTLDSMLQNNQVSWNAIQNLNQQAVNMVIQNNTINSAVVDAFSGKLAVGIRSFEQLIVNPHYFAENAPATQDTGGEGTDTGQNKEDNKKPAADPAV